MAIQAIPDFIGRVILITGAGEGLGAALARTAGGAGAEVILLGRNVSKLESVYDAILEAGGPRPAIYPLDLEGATPREYRKLRDLIYDSCGHLDVLIHNAAMLGSQTPLEFCQPMEWMRVLQTNLNGPLFLTQACLPLLRIGEEPAIVFIDDERQSAYWGAYGVSKAAAAAMARMLADELEVDPSIAVHCIAPGPMRTPLRRLAFPGELPEEAPLPEEAAVPMILATIATQPEPAT